MSDTEIAPPIVHDNPVSDTEWEESGRPISTEEATGGTAESAGESAAEVAEEDKDRRPRGWLESDVKAITDRFVTGEVKVEEGKPLTPHRVARLVQTEGNLESLPSTGAVAAVFKRWSELGFAVLNEKPFAFVDYTEEGRELGLKALKERRSENRKANRKAAKATQEESTPVAESTPTE